MSDDRRKYEEVVDRFLMGAATQADVNAADPYVQARRAVALDAAKNRPDLRNQERSLRHSKSTKP